MFRIGEYPFEPKHSGHSALDKVAEKSDLGAISEY